MTTALEEQLQTQQRQLAKYEEELRKLREDRGSAKRRPTLYRVVLTGGPCGGKTT